MLIPFIHCTPTLGVKAPTLNAKDARKEGMAMKLRRRDLRTASTILMDLSVKSASLERTAMHLAWCLMTHANHVEQANLVFTKN
tara:strand:- start:133 stop:384 length:252 start_codon:yes stop_codon:yes gene_type:complete